MNNRYLILILIILFSIIPIRIFASFITDIPDQMLAGVEEVLSPYFGLLIKILVVYIFGYMSLHWAYSNLAITITRQAELFNNMKPVAMNFWKFTSGISNMILVVIFIIIAFAFIFKINTLEAKKSLPRLIMVAILINFSFLFTQIIIDVFQIIYNTFLLENTFFENTLDVIMGPIGSQISEFISFFTGAAILLAIPWANAFFQALILTIFPITFLPILMTMLIQDILLCILFLFFFVLLVLFLARPFILEILAVLSPLVFVCLILPQTKKFWFWDKWFKYLLEWLMLGIVFLFLLALSFSTLKTFTPNISLISVVPILSWFQFPQIVLYYLVLVSYLAVVFFVVKSTLPQGAQAMISGAKGLGRRLKGFVGKSGLKKTFTEAGEFTGDKLSKYIASDGPQELGTKWRSSTKRGPLSTVSRWAGQKIRDIKEEEDKKPASDARKAEKEAEILNDSDLISLLIKNLGINNNPKSPFRDLEKSLIKLTGSLNQAIKSGRIDKVCEEAGIDDKELQRIMKEADKLKIGKTLKEARPDLIEDDAERKKIIEKMKPENIKNISSISLKDEKVLKIILENWDGQQMGPLVSQFGRTAVIAIEEEIEKGTNPNQQLLRYFKSQAGQVAGFPSLETEEDKENEENKKSKSE